MTTGKARVYAYVTDEVRQAAIEAMHKSETLSDFVETAMRNEVERRKTQKGPAPAAPLRLPRGRRPK